jgi:hypothetical protein
LYYQKIKKERFFKQNEKCEENPTYTCRKINNQLRDSVRLQMLYTKGKHVIFFSLLFFIVPPHQILVYDASGRDVAGSVGPLLEDNNLVLTCEVRGGECREFL